ncbi:hypothetical protein [Paenibacillus sp. 2TAB19]|uniref:hypothetical protein n=1 Tax=Paenibacillus sp. 2TAB19 TaxID=3233003 RepID=UPI003F9458A6
MNKKLTAVIVAVAVLFCIGVVKPAKVFACSCAMAQSAEEQVKDELERSSAVFAGKVLTVTQPPEKEIMSSADPVEVQFEVSEVWKGDVQERTVVYTALSSASCGIENFVAGAEYIVSAYESESALHTTICNMTKPISAAGEELKALGEGKQPQPIAMNVKKEKNEATEIPLSADGAAPPDTAADDDAASARTSSGSINYMLIAASVLLIAAVMIMWVRRNRKQ